VEGSGHLYFWLLGREKSTLILGFKRGSGGRGLAKRGIFGSETCVFADFCRFSQFFAKTHQNLAQISMFLAKVVHFLKFLQPVRKGQKPNTGK